MIRSRIPGISVCPSVTELVGGSGQRIHSYDVWSLAMSGTFVTKALVLSFMQRYEGMASSVSRGKKVGT